MNDKTDYPLIKPKGLRGKAAANYCGLSVSTLDLLVKRGDLTARYVGRSRVFLVDELDRFLESRPNIPRAA